MFAWGYYFLLDRIVKSVLRLCTQREIHEIYASFRLFIVLDTGGFVWCNK